MVLLSSIGVVFWSSDRNWLLKLVHLVVVSVWTGAELCIFFQNFSSDPTIAFAFEIKDVFLAVWVSGAAAGGNGGLVFAIE